MYKTIRRLWNQGKQSKNLFVLVILYCMTGILGILRTTSIGYITQNTIQSNTDSLLYLIGVLGSISVCETVLLWYSNVRKVKMKQSMFASFKTHTVDRLLKSNFDFTQSLEQGDIIGRFNNDVSSLASAADMSITVVKSVILLIVLMAGVSFFDYRMTLVFFATIPFYFISQSIITAKSVKNIVPWKQAMGETNSLTQELLNNRSTIKAYTLKPLALKWLEKALTKTSALGIKGIGILYAMNLPQFLFTFAPVFTVAIAGVYLVTNDSLSVSSFISIQLLTQLALQSLLDIQNAVQNIPQLLASTSRIFPLWDQPAETSGPVDEGNCESPWIIEFEHVYFAYPNSPQKLILNDLSFTIKAGDKVGLVGTSGSGKSTIFRLLTGLYKPISGRIKVQGIDLDDWNKQALRSHISMVSQNTSLFDESILINLSYAKNDVSHKAAMEALKQADLSSYVENAPEGLQTVVGEKGSKLSGGQRQRLSIARSILRDAPIVLYDEATSALDAKAEKEIDTIMKQAAKDKTQLVIAHRFTTIKDLDQILVLDHGSIVESGNHQTLIEKQGLYHALYQQQGGNRYEEKE